MMQKNDVDPFLLQGLPEPTEGCAACKRYLEEIVWLRNKLRSPLTALDNALEECLRGFYGEALQVIDAWVKEHSEPPDEHDISGPMVADEDTDELFRYADALEMLRQIMVQHSESGPQSYLHVNELVPVLKVAEIGGSKPVEFSAAAANLSVTRSVLDKLVTAIKSGSLRRVQKVVRDYQMIFGEEEFETPEPGTCGQCGLPLEAGITLSPRGMFRVYVCKECGVPVVLTKLKGPVALYDKLWNERATPEMRQEWEKRKTK